MINREDIRRATEQDIPEILMILGQNVAECLYMYIDIKKYGLKNPEIKIWIIQKSNQQIDTVLMQYYESVQIYTCGQELDYNIIAEVLGGTAIKMVSGKSDIIRQIYEKSEEEFDYEEGEIYKISSYRKFPGVEFVEHASVGDVNEIAKLICSESVFLNNYEEKNLALQLKERMESGMGRSLIIRERNKIVAHIATYAEYENLVITSGLVVHPNYRKSGYGFIIESYLVNELLQEEKDIYTFILEPKRAAVLTAMGARMCGTYGKITKIDSAE